MAITYPLNMPTYGISNIEFTYKNANFISKSPFTYQGQVQDWGGQQILANVSINSVMQDHGEDWVSFLTALGGSKGTFLFYDPAFLGNPPGATGDVRVDGAGQTGGTVNLKGGAANFNGFMRRGDWIQIRPDGINARLYKVLNTVNTDASGDMSVDIWPNLRMTPPDSAVVIRTQPKGLFRLSQGSFNYSIDNQCKYSINFSCEDVV